MKYIFYSHSPITQVLIDAIVESEKIPKDEIIILYNRVLIDSLHSISTHDYIQTRKIYTHKLVLRLLLDLQILRFNLWVRRITSGDYFILYIPHYRDLHFKLLCNQKRCVSVQLIEEGSLSYCSKEVFDSVNAEIQFPKFLNILFRKLTREVREIGASYVLNDQAFTFINKKKNVLSATRSLVQAQPSGIKNILVLTPYVSILGIPIEDYISGLERIIAALCMGRSAVQIHFKFHLSDSNEVKDRTRKVFFDFPNVSFIELQANFSIERILLAQPINLLAFRSVVCFYAKLFGSKVFILDDFFAFNIVSPRSDYIDKWLSPHRLSSYKELSAIPL